MRKKGYEMASFRTERPTTLTLLNSCSVYELLLGEKVKKIPNNNLCYCLKMQKAGERQHGATHLSGRMVIVIDEDDRNENKSHVGQVCHFEKTSKWEV